MRYHETSCGIVTYWYIIDDNAADGYYVEILNQVHKKLNMRQPSMEKL